MTKGNTSNQSTTNDLSDSIGERLQNMQELRRSAWGTKYEEVRANLKAGNKKVKVMMASAGESLEDFFIRTANR